MCSDCTASVFAYRRPRVRSRSVKSPAVSNWYDHINREKSVPLVLGTRRVICDGVSILAHSSVSLPGGRAMTAGQAVRHLPSLGSPQREPGRKNGGEVDFMS